MWENLFRHTNIRPESVQIPDGNAADIPAHCAEYEERIRAAGGIDIQVLGIGTDGYIGFNEPTSSLGGRQQARLAGVLIHGFAFPFVGEKCSFWS